MSENTAGHAIPRAALGPVACRSCDLFEICCVIDALPGASALQRCPSLRTVGPGEKIFRAGDPVESVYAIRKGFAKSERTAADGRARVIALHVPGEVLGTDSVRAGFYADDVVAVSPATLCQLPLKPLLGSSQGASVLREGLELLMTSTREEPKHASGPVEQRLERLELSVMKRMQAHGLPTKGLCLKLSKQAVADLLGVHVDSLTRSLKRRRTKWTRKIDDAFSLLGV
jgi:CRP/FNR family transcriptional regulator, anaerobic regulatory protein